MVDTSFVTATELTDIVTREYEENDSNYIHSVTVQFGYRPNTLLIMYSTIAVLALLGVVGNIVSMVIWTRPQWKPSVAVFLTALAACDLLILITRVTPIYLLVLRLNYQDWPAIAYMNKFITPYVIFWFESVYYIPKTTSVYLTLAITLERYNAVCRPFQARHFCTHGRACKYTAAIISVSILYNLYEFFRQEVVTRVDDNSDISYDIEDTELGRSPLFQSIYEIYFTWIDLLLFMLLPLILIGVLNTLIYLKMRMMMIRRQALTVSQRKENRLTMMLVYVVAEFLVCSSVGVLNSIVEISQLPREQLGFNMYYLLPLDIFFDTFNSSSNVVTYVIFGSGFRETLLNTFSCCRGPCRIRLSNGTEDRELDARIPELPNCQTLAGNE